VMQLIPVESCLHCKKPMKPKRKKTIIKTQTP